MRRSNLDMSRYQLKSLSAILVLYLLFIILCVLMLQSIAHAAPVTGCDGPPELCSQITILQNQLASSRSVQASEVTRAQELRLISIAGVISVVLKGLLSMLQNWSIFFRTEQAKARIRAITIVVGLGAGLAANLGFGLPWWQAIVVAGGGPGAIAVHELLQLVPALRGESSCPKCDAVAATDDDPRNAPARGAEAI